MSAAISLPRASGACYDFLTMLKFSARFLRLVPALVFAAGLAASTLAAAQSAAPAKRAAPVAVGDMAPDFTLEDQDGRTHTLSAERGKRAVVLIFYRGYW
jgi:cytochrome oxidase Cu insertion factor (SCO1/SenC/PrrC family)